MASRFGRLTIRRQILAEGAGAGAGTGTGTGHVMPGNAVLPPHGGIVITRGLQEIACLLPDTLPFVTATRLLGWQTHEDAAEVVCTSTVRTVVREHGAALAEAERGEVAWLAAQQERGGGAALRPRLTPGREPRRRAGWPPELSAAVDQALADGEARPRAAGGWPTGSGCCRCGARSGTRCGRERQTCATWGRASARGRWWRARTRC